MSVWGIVTAAGSGTRFGSRKQHLFLGGRTLLQRAVDALAEECDGLVVSLPADEPRPDWLSPEVLVVAGGATRQQSVGNALAVVPLDARIIVVHGPSHPLADVALVAAVVEAVRRGADAAMPVRPVLDALKRIEDNEVRSVDKTGVVTAQCPQAFAAVALRTAHRQAGEAAEDSELIERTGGSVVVVPGPADNLHVAPVDDLELLRRILGEGSGAS